jgi:hypothetical protein
MYSYEFIEGNEEEDLDRIVITLHPSQWAVGSATLYWEITNPEDPEDTADFAFTYNQLWFKNCPYRVPYGLVKLLPVTITGVTISWSVIGQAVMFITVSAFGDFGPFRKVSKTRARSERLLRDQKRERSEHKKN